MILEKLSHRKVLPRQQWKAVVAELLEHRTCLSTSSPNSFDFTQGFTGNGMTLNYSAYIGKDLKLTLGGGTSSESRTAFYSTPVPIGKFNAHFVTTFNSATGGGMTLTLENNASGATARGATGNGMGYQGITTSAAISIDGYNNASGFYTNGTKPINGNATSLTPSGITLTSGHPIEVSVSYNGSALTVSEHDRVNGNTATQTYSSVNLATTLGGSTAFIGLTGGADATFTAQIVAGEFSYTDTTAAPNGGVNLTWPSNVFADAMKFSVWADSTTAANLPPTYLDSTGWPTKDATLNLGGAFGGTHDENLYAGDYAIQFTGQAVLSSPQGTITNQSYNSATNTTTATLTLSASLMQENTSPTLVFATTKLTSTSAVGSGVTGVSVMMPTAPGSATSFPQSQIFTPGLLAELQNNKIGVLRTMAATATVRSTVNTWSDRTLPSYATQQKVWDNDGNALSYLGNGLSWEYCVALANAGHVDLWINVPMNADATYITNLAKLIKYGADASGNPYSTTQASPVWAPLGAGQKVYIEFGNEVWNTAFPETLTNQANAVADVQAYLAGQINAQATTGSQIDYDGVAGAYNSSTGKYANQQILNDRLQALNIKKAGDSFRAVFGDAAMQSLVRPVYAWNRSGDVIGTPGLGADGLTFLNDYFNNADVAPSGTNHFATPHPVSYFIWGGGGAFYDGSANDTGNDAPTLSNPSFEDGNVWAYAGTAATVANGSMSGFTAPNGTHALSLPAGGSAYENVQYTASGNQIASFSVAATPGTAGTLSLIVNNVTVWSTTSFNTAAFQRIYSSAYAVTYGTRQFKLQFTGSGTVYLDNIDVAPLKNDSFDDGLSQWTTAGMVAASPVGSGDGNPGGAGTIAASLLTGASIEQQIYFSGGPSAVAFTAALKRISGTSYGRGTFTVTLDGTAVPILGTNNGAVVLRSNLDGTAGGYGTIYTDVVNPTAGLHTLKITYSDTAYTNRAFIDTVEVDSQNSMFQGVYNSGPIKSIFAVQSDTRIAHLYGIHSAAYEGGITLGFDNQSPLQSASEQDSRMSNLVTWLLQNYYSLGGELPVYFQSSGPNHGLLAGYDKANLAGSGGSAKLAGVAAALAAAQPAIDSRTQHTSPKFVPKLPGTQTFNSTIYPGPKTASTSNTTPQMATLYVRIESAGYYNVSAAMDPSQATTASLIVDGAVQGSITAGSGTSSATYRVWLSTGLHGIELLNTGTTNGIVNTMAVLATT